MTAPDPHLFATWASVADGVAATRSKRSKVTLLADHLKGLRGPALETAARFFTGRVFAAWDGRTLGIGGAALGRAITALGDLDPEAISAIWSRHADVGDTVREVVGDRTPEGPLLLTTDVAALYEAIAATKAVAREELLLGMLRRCSAAEASYACKLITSELRIGLRDGLVEEAIAVAFGAEPAAVSRADMLAGDLGSVAVLAAEERLNDAAPALFAPLRFMLASPASDAAEIITRMGDDVWVEDKYDGIRCQVHALNGRVALYSRDLKEITAQFPEVADGTWPDGVILDGEILAFKEGRVLPFFALQRRLGRKNPSAEMREEIPVVHVAWDCLHVGTESLLDHPLNERRARLEQLALPDHAVLAHLERINGAAALDEQFDAARARLNEGLIVKDPDSLYLPGRRGYHWMKLKRPLDTLDVVVTGAEYGHGKRRAVLSDVTFAVRDEDSGELVTLGKAYTGLTDVEIAAMTEMLIASSVSQHGRFHSVVPQIVLEVAFDSIQESTRHRSGHALRFPRIVRWRTDKAPEDIDTLARVRDIAQRRAAEFTQRVDAPRRS